MKSTIAAVLACCATLTAAPLASAVGCTCKQHFLKYHLSFTSPPANPECYTACFCSEGLDFWSRINESRDGNTITIPAESFESALKMLQAGQPTTEPPPELPLAVRGDGLLYNGEAYLFEGSQLLLLRISPEEWKQSLALRPPGSGGAKYRPPSPVKVLATGSNDCPSFRP